MSQAVASAMAAASQSLRETAKWMVGGVAVTAAGVFAGSSLTSLGSLEWPEDRTRLLLAAGGGLIGFLCLAVIFFMAVRVLTHEITTLSEVLVSSPQIAAALNARYGHTLPTGVADLQDYLLAVETAVKAVHRTPAQDQLIAQAREDAPEIGANAIFLVIKSRFDELVLTLAAATPLAIVGFGLFAWAANPPKTELSTIRAAPAAEFVEPGGTPLPLEEPEKPSGP